MATAVFRSLSRVARLELVSDKLVARADAVARLDVEVELVCVELELKADDISFNADWRSVSPCDTEPDGDAPATAVEPAVEEDDDVSPDAPMLCREVKSARI